MLKVRNHSPTAQQKEYQQFLINNTHALEQVIVKLSAMCRKCRKSRGKESIIHRIQTLTEKMQMELKKYEDSLRKCNIKTLSKGSITSMKAYFISNFNSLTREAHHIFTTNDNIVKEPTNDDFRKLKMYQNQMCEEWEQTNPFNSNNSKTITPIDRNNLSKQASDYLHQQFLAIRMIAYKMYEQYSDHSHPDLHKQLKQTEQQQHKLQKQIQQAKLRRTQLLGQQKRMQQQLAELKKINELVGRRYFMDNSRADTNFTS